MAKAKKSPYEVLGIPKDADAATIKKSYRKRARKAHPDAGGSADEMAEVNHAYDILGDAQRRLLYDATGQEKPRAAVEDEAKQLVLQAFAQALQNESVVDCLKAAKGVVRGHKQNLEIEKNRVIAAKSRLCARRAEVTVKRSDNLFHQLIDAELQRLEWAQKEIAHKGEVCKAALKMLDEYESSAKEPKVMEFVITMGTTASTGW